MSLHFYFFEKLVFRLYVFSVFFYLLSFEFDATVIEFNTCVHYFRRQGSILDKLLPENGWAPEIGSAQTGPCENLQKYEITGRLNVFKAYSVLREIKLPSGNE